MRQLQPCHDPEHQPHYPSHTPSNPQSSHHIYQVHLIPSNSSSPAIPQPLLPPRLALHISNLITGSGLGVLLSLAGAGLDPLPTVSAMALGAGLFVLWALCSRLSSPAWLCLSTATLNLVLTLSVGLTLLARVCPPEGKELALIPTYFLLCMSRLQLATVWPVWALELLFILVFVVLLYIPSSPLEPGFLGYSGALDGLNAGICIAISVFYDGVSQWCRLSEDLVHFPRYPELHPYFLPVDAAFYALPRWVALLGLALLGQGALLYLFLEPLPTYSAPHSPNYLAPLYGLVLVLTAMCTASRWFQCLQKLSSSPQKLTRLLHILHLLLIGSAWAFPIQHPSLALGLYSTFALVCSFAGILGGLGTSKHVQP
jgi:hypothetical protein